MSSSNMQMLTKFESKSTRVKGIAFHPRLPLLASSLHNGSIQLWNYQTGTIYDRLDEHDGPVRGVSFHPTQPLLVSGGDDYKIKVWNHKTRRCVFTLNGHLDYVRTVFFHHEHPWILSASDDQTIRIWNWQSRTCIAILAGHNHFIMCAQFHPREDLIVSASMDQTVRVWDISGLVKKNTTASSTPAMMGGGEIALSLNEQIARANANAGGMGMGMGGLGGPGGQPDMFGNNDVVVKYVLEGHDRGVNWASFHPTLPLIISAGDDRQLKLWRMSDTKAWEVDTCRGHFNNVSSALFHPRHELIVSAGEDKTLRVWDMSRRTALATFRRESERFWVLTAHPTLNLFAAGHDNGLIVFKLERERPAMAINGNTLYWIKDRVVRSLDYETGKEEALLSTKKLGGQYVQPRTMSFNPAEKSVIVTSLAGDSGVYDLAPLPREGTTDISESATVGKRGQGSCAIFVARNRLAVLDKTAQTIEIRDLSNTATKTITCPSQTNEIFFGGTGSLLLSTTTGVTLYDIQQQKILSEVTSPPVKYVVWSLDGSMVALLSKHTITLANKTLSSSSLIHETIRIKSAAWDDAGVLIYSTLNHIKYALPQGDSGIIKTLEQPVYLTRVRGKVVSALDRSARPLNINIDPTEYRFKLALVQQKYDEVLKIIQTSNLVGQAIIAYLQKKGYPEIALHFVQDKSTRFDLAIECGNLDVALETAEAVNKEEVWERLGSAALKQGNHKIVERAYQRTKSFEKLSFLYLITGNEEKLAKMQIIAEKRGDQMARFHNALLNGDAKTRVNILDQVGLAPLAYITAKRNGLLDRAAEIAEQAGMTAGLTELEMTGKLGLDSKDSSTDSLKPPTVVSKTFNYNWPLITGNESFFDQALVANAEEGGVIFKDNVVSGGKAHDVDNWLESDAFVDADQDPYAEEDEVALAIGAGAAAEGAEEAWDLDDAEIELDPLDEPVVEPLAEAAPDENSLEPGSSEREHWLRNSPVAADHASAGSFSTSMKLLKRQAGITDFKPLKPLMLALHSASRVFLNGSANLDPLELPLRRNPEATEARTMAKPANFRNVKQLSNEDLQDAYKAVSANKLEDARKIFQSLLWKLVMTVGKDEAEGAEILELIALCREYLLGISIELSRRSLAASEEGSTPQGQVRNLELAALFTHAGMQTPHKIIALRSAMAVASKAGNNNMAAGFARRLLELNPQPRIAQSAQTTLTAADRNPRDAISVPTYDAHERAFVICAASHTLIPGAGQGSIQDPLCGARYLPEYAGQLCRITQISEIGRVSTGLRTWS